MKILFLTTHTPNCEPFWRSLEAVGHEVHVEQYDNRPHDRHHELVGLARHLSPDFSVYIGAYEPSHGRPVPSADILCRLREVAPFIMLCGDAADAPWWPVLHEYHRRACFTKIVAIDGSLATPIASFPEGLTLLTPLDTRVYKHSRLWLWNERQIKLGMIGGTGHRGQMINDLQTRGLLDYRPGPVGRSYEDFASTLSQTKITLNLAQTGTGQHLHVKGRVVEAGFAGSAVLETRGSPLSEWEFIPGEDYLEYDNVADIALILDQVSDETFERMAARYHAKMTTYHSPEKFWEQVFACQASQ